MSQLQQRPRWSCSRVGPRLIRERSVEWIKSGGGPLVCLETALAHRWRGVEVGGSARVDLKIDAVSDYERACRVKDYLGTIDLMEGSALVLGDMPLETSVWSDALKNILIVRLFYIEPGTDLEHLLQNIRNSIFINSQETIIFEVHSNNMIIFDSAFPGDDQKKAILRFQLLKGRYRILTSLINPDSGTSLLLHKFYHLM
jgi:hypothetical protein